MEKRRGECQNGAPLAGAWRNSAGFWQRIVQAAARWDAEAFRRMRAAQRASVLFGLALIMALSIVLVLIVAYGMWQYHYLHQVY